MAPMLTVVVFALILQPDLKSNLNPDIADGYC